MLTDLLVLILMKGKEKGKIGNKFPIAIFISYLTYQRFHDINWLIALFVTSTTFQFTTINYLFQLFIFIYFVLWTLFYGKNKINEICKQAWRKKIKNNCEGNLIRQYLSALCSQGWTRLSYTQYCRAAAVHPHASKCSINKPRHFVKTWVSSEGIHLSSYLVAGLMMGAFLSCEEVHLLQRPHLLASRH